MARAEGGDRPVTEQEKAVAWLRELRQAEIEWKMTDFRTTEYGQRLDAVLALVKNDYIENALRILERP